jgi:hypothetical protein
VIFREVSIGRECSTGCHLGKSPSARQSILLVAMLPEAVTDHYLADLTTKHGAKLATFDQNISHKVSRLSRS